MRLQCLLLKTVLFDRSSEQTDMTCVSDAIQMLNAFALNKLHLDEGLRF